MSDFIETSKDAWGYSPTHLKKKNDYTYEIKYNSKIINNYLTWYVDTYANSKYDFKKIPYRPVDFVTGH
jgi:hypothetical protein